MDELKKLLSQYDLDGNEITLYLNMVNKGSLSATELSRYSGIPKTSVYRFIDQLKQKKLVNEIVEENGRLFEAAPIENLKYKVIEQEQKLKNLTESLPLIIDTLSQTTRENISKSKIKYYSGLEGLKQVTWNSSKAKDVLRIFEIKDMSQFLNYSFCEYTREEFVRNKVFTRELTNEKDIPDWTNITQMVENYWELRYVDPIELKMEFEMLVYNDVFVMYNYESDDIFCAEIYNERLARMQKQIFDFIWIKGKRFKKLNKHGASQLIE